MGRGPVMADAAGGGIRIVEDDLSGAAIRSLLEQHWAGMLASSPEGNCHYLDFSALKHASVSFWSIWSGPTLAGCGALKRHDTALGEVKSMRIADGLRGQGFGHAMLCHIIAAARGHGLAHLKLETGSGPDFADALALYARAGFVPCAPFATYRPDAFSRYLGLELTPA